MLFSSMTFIYIFLPILLLIYFLSPKKLHNTILLIASIIFYAWGEPKYLLLMFLTIIINFIGAIAIEKYESHKKSTLITFVLLDLLFLIYFKYFDFLIVNINALFRSNIDLVNIALPLGISFYTFQAMSYIIDVYRKEVKAQRNFFKLALYICLFPQLIAGPIVKYHDIEGQIDARIIDFEKFNTGVKRFIIGLSKKVLLANTFGLIADKVFSQDPHAFNSAIAWLGAVSYTFQIYFDFSGYSDMAIGLGLLFGFNFQENFNYPYISRSVTEFWRRWHISLSTWFKQYVYIPLGGNRDGRVKTCINLGIVFLLTGIWHGASWNFIIWGIWSAIFIIVEKWVNLKELESKPQRTYINILRHIYCVLFFTIGWVIFRADDLKYAIHYIMNMFGCLSVKLDAAYPLTYYIDNIQIITFIVAILCSVPVFKNILKPGSTIKKVAVNIWLFFLFILSSMSIAASTYNPFIYFRF